MIAWDAIFRNYRSPTFLSAGDCRPRGGERLLFFCAETHFQGNSLSV